MELKLDIGIEQLVELIRQLPARQRAKLEAALNESKTAPRTKDKTFEELLLSGPTLTKTELERIAEAREAINKWRSR